MDRAQPRPGARRLVEALPAIAFLGTFGLFAVDKWQSARSVAGSGRGMLTVVALAGGYVLLATVLRRLRAWWVAPAVLTVVVLGLAAWIVRPYYVDETADRQLVSGPIGDVDDTSTTASTAPPDDAPGTTAAPATPLRVATGTFVGIDHDASGTASLVRDVDGSYVVRFEAFDIEGVPDPRVHLVEGPDVREAGGLDLGVLPGNQGTLLDIRVPDGAEPGPGWTVLVWCRAFAVPVANATLG